MTETDEALVQKSRRHDRPAFEQLVRRTARLVYSRIYLEVGNAHLAEDLVQETYLTAWRSIEQVTDAAGFRTWLLSIAKTTTIDAGRRNSRKKRTAPGLSRESPDARPDPAPDPSDAAEQKDERDRALSALRSLPEEYRQPLVLRYLGGADYEAIGRQLGLSNGSLRGLLSRGMTKLREELNAGRK